MKKSYQAVIVLIILYFAAYFYLMFNPLTVLQILNPEISKGIYKPLPYKKAHNELKTVTQLQGKTRYGRHLTDLSFRIIVHYLENIQINNSKTRQELDNKLHNIENLSLRIICIKTKDDYIALCKKTINEILSAFKLTGSVSESDLVDISVINDNLTTSNYEKQLTRIFVKISQIMNNMSYSRPASH